MKRNTILFAVAAVLLLAGSCRTRACTSFVFRGANGPVFARNFDYMFGGGTLLVNPRGLEKVALTMGNRARWTARYGSVTFNLYGREQPMGGMNEAGLVVENMWLESTIYPGPDARPGVNNLQRIQFMLDSCATTAEVLAAAPGLRINPDSPARIHYLVCDAEGEAAAIEYIDGELVIHAGDSLAYAAMANSVYEKSAAFLASGADTTGMNDADEANSLGRFATAAEAAVRLDAERPEEMFAEAFAVLDTVCAGPWTHWRIVYDIAARRIVYRTHVNPAERSISLAALDFSCASPVSGIELDAPGEGDVAGALAPFTTEMNRALVRSSFGNTDFLKEAIPLNILEIIAVYPERLVCRE
ncbi:MAG: linear amide C-N hydrolase [Candidatus Krumholzibacteriota bacterium]|nr:linear amide C-N hydrolase [Candidatus Krumholzibacteriota bacterium]